MAAPSGAQCPGGCSDSGCRGDSRYVVQRLWAAALPGLGWIAFKFAGPVHWLAIYRVGALMGRLAAVIETASACAVVVRAVLAELLLLDVAHGVSRCTNESAREWRAVLADLDSLVCSREHCYSSWL